MNIDGKLISQKRKDALKMKIDELKEQGKRIPKLTVILVGEDQASQTYVRNKDKACAYVGMISDIIRLDEQTSQEELVRIIQSLNQDDKVDGILVQLPLPSHIDEDCILNTIDSCKDVDGFRKDSYFAPCTPKGILDWLEYNHIDLEGKDVAVIGRSDIVGKPLTRMLINKGATVVCCNSHTKDIKAYTKHADIVITAIGKPRYFDASYFSNKTELVIDVGINRDENNKLCGDVDDENVLLAFPHIYITPVPGGVGLLTRVALLDNVVAAYQQHYLTSSYINKY